MKKKITIKNKILLYFIGSALTIASLLFLLQIFISYSALKTHINDKNSEVLVKLERILSVPLLKHDYVTVVDLIDAETKTSNLDYIWISDMNGNIIACNDEEQIMLPIADKYKNNKDFQIFNMKNGEKIAIIPNYGIIYEIGEKTIAGSAIVFVLIIAVLIILIFRLSFKLTLPLKRVVVASDEMAHGKLDFFLPTSNIAEIDAMSDSIIKTVTNLKELSENLKNEKQLLKQNEEKYRALFDKSLDALVIFDREFNLIDCNAAAIKLFGCESFEHLMSLTVVDISPQYQIDGRLSSDNAREVFSIALNSGAHFFEWLHKTAHGENFFTSVLLTRLSINQKIVVQATIRDISKEKKAEEETRQSQKMETVGTLAGGLAHDFNNVLSGVMGTLSIINHKLSKDTLSQENLKKYLGIIEKSGVRATEMVQQLLTLSRKKELTLVPVNLNSSIKQIVNICNNSFDKSIIINPKYNKSPAMVEADPAQIEQVILNACINASHAMTIMKSKTDTWGGELTISLEFIQIKEYFKQYHPEAKHNQYWLLSVRDNGIGMTKETVQKIFDPFFTTKGKGVGTGLGLSMSHAIIAQHQGFISVYSEIGIGTTFNIFLPVSTEDSVKDNVETYEIDDFKGEGLILVVDDEEVLRNLAKDILEESGYEVVFAVDGQDAVEQFEKYHKELKMVLLDMVMPKLSGKEAYIKMRDINPNVNVLLASGFKQDDRVKFVSDLGAKGFMQKPYTFDKLAKKVYEIIN